MLQNDTLRFYHIGDHLAALPEEPPASLRLSRYELQIDLPVQLVTQDTRRASARLWQSSWRIGCACQVLHRLDHTNLWQGHAPSMVEVQLHGPSLSSASELAGTSTRSTAADG